MAITLKLGSFVFADTEIPEAIRFGGKQALAVHELVGGARVIDAMGRRDRPLEWAGLLRGSQALPRARQLDQMRVDGAQVTLSWHELTYPVVIEEFEADFERFYQIPYRIRCVPLRPQAAAAAGTGIDALVAQDMATATTLSGQVGDSTLTGLMGTLNSAVSNVSSFANATQSTINTVLLPLSAAQQQVSTLMSAVGNTIQNVTTLGGILPNSLIGQQASRLLGQVTAMNQAPELVSLRNVLGRLHTNVSSINGGASSITTAGGSLYDIAAKAYGDATAWTGLARANNLTDPAIQGVQTIQIPANPDTSNGVLNA